MSFHYEASKPVLDEASFSLRRGAKFTLMGQNGAGKSTLFKLLGGELEPEDGRIIRAPNMTIAVSHQVIPREQLMFSVREFFQVVFKETIYNIDVRIKEVLAVVNLPIDDYAKKISDFSGGQQARLLLASAIIQDPDLLLLDEPTNNLDVAGIEHLTDFIKNYGKTVLVISHDAEFLNSFTEGVLYLDIFKKKVDLYVGNYFDVVEQIGIQVTKEKSKNARLAKSIQEKKDKANFFANKGGRLRAVAKKMREVASEAEENMVTLHRDDKTIRDFSIPCQNEMSPILFQLYSFSRLKNGRVEEKKAKVELRKGDKLLLSGPNGIGKSTLLEALANKKAEGGSFDEGVKIGYYRQDFSTLDFNETVYKSLSDAMIRSDEHKLRSVASGFLINKELMNSEIGTLSEGQKGLVSFARLVLMEPGILILDEPTNHINFRHLPIIANAINNFEGAVILVTHSEEFLTEIEIDFELKMDK